MADPLLQGQYPIRGLYQALAVAAMCLQEQAATRPLIGDVVTALTYLASQTYDPNSPSAQSNKIGPSTPRRRRKTTDSLDMEDGGLHYSPSTHKREAQNGGADSPMSASSRNGDVDRERAVALAKVWGENGKERKRMVG